MCTCKYSNQNFLLRNFLPLLEMDEIKNIVNKTYLFL